MKVFVQGDFFNWASPENVSRLAPPKNALTAPPHFEKVLSMAAERGEIPNTFNIFDTQGGPVWDFNIFLKSVTYWPTISKFKGGPVKKITLYIKLSGSFCIYILKPITCQNGALSIRQSFFLFFYEQTINILRNNDALLIRYSKKFIFSFINKQTIS